ncbi:MAG: hypothetical protein LBB67_03920 [Oscillospiraceae bacterium]|nr:hypothetical protein [Oscillospiraceae bacterium]
MEQRQKQTAANAAAVEQYRQQMLEQARRGGQNIAQRSQHTQSKQPPTETIHTQQRHPKESREKESLGRQVGEVLQTAERVVARVEPVLEKAEPIATSTGIQINPEALEAHRRKVDERRRQGTKPPAPPPPNQANNSTPARSNQASNPTPAPPKQPIRPQNPVRPTPPIYEIPEALPAPVSRVPCGRKNAPSPCCTRRTQKPSKPIPAPRRETCAEETAADQEAYETELTPEDVWQDYANVVFEARPDASSAFETTQYNENAYDGYQNGYAGEDLSTVVYPQMESRPPYYSPDVEQVPVYPAYTEEASPQFDSLEAFLEYNDGYGILTVQVLDAERDSPVAGAEVKITNTINGALYAFYDVRTDAGGRANQLRLPAPNVEQTFTPAEDGIPYATYDITVVHPNGISQVFRNATIFDDIESVQVVRFGDSNIDPQIYDEARYTV